ncbi:MAG: hypothetical protein MUD10_03140, partial [Candidatus Pacebacteria bacterium]|nr:hypothetical protein [Candidatus Paceibacterota bacterium]
TATGAATVYSLPIPAVQFTDSGNFVLTVGNDGVIAGAPVTVGELVGENVQITGGLTPDMKILSSVRGFKAGGKVRIQE